MNKVCAWCGSALSDPTNKSETGAPVSHGICQPCSRKLWAEAGGVPLREFLASLDVPTFVVDGEGRVRKANPQGLDMVGKESAEVEDHLGGEVFDCVNSTLPGGCGSTELCPACTVRNTILGTYRTGQSQVRVPASLKINRGGVSQEVRFLLTTEKSGDRVLVQVEIDEDS